MESERSPTAFTNDATVKIPRRLVEDDKCGIIGYQNDVIGNQQPHHKE